LRHGRIDTETLTKQTAPIGTDAAARSGEPAPAKPTNPARGGGNAVADKPTNVTPGSGAERGNSRGGGTKHTGWRAKTVCKTARLYTASGVMRPAGGVLRLSTQNQGGSYVAP
jgi:hypothetical protein